MRQQGAKLQTSGSTLSGERKLRSSLQLMGKMGLTSSTLCNPFCLRFFKLKQDYGEQHSTTIKEDEDCSTWRVLKISFCLIQRISEWLNFTRKNYTTCSIPRTRRGFLDRFREVTDEWMAISRNLENPLITHRWRHLECKPNRDFPSPAIPVALCDKWCLSGGQTFKLCLSVLMCCKHAATESPADDIVL